jgi:hypothetical protein
VKVYGGALSPYPPAANLHPAQQPRVIRTDTDEPEGGRFAALVTQLVEKAREEKARLSTPLSATLERGASVPCDAGLGPTANGCDGAPAEGGRFAALVTQLVEKAREEKARLALGMSNVIGGAEHTSQPTTAAGAGAGAAGAPVSVRITLGCCAGCRFADG